MGNKDIHIDYSKDFDFNSKERFLTYLGDEKIIFVGYKKYDGPITMQFLPSGGIQSVFGYKLIVKVNNGFLEVNELIYNGKLMTSKEFIELKNDVSLVNQVLE